MVLRVHQAQIPDLQSLFHRLQEARSQPSVRMYFKDGRVLDGAITFVERLGTGRLINVDQEFSLEFSIHDLRRVEY